MARVRCMMKSRWCFAVVLFWVAAAVVCTGAPVAADQEEDGALSKRIALAQESSNSQWIIAPYRPNYILPVTYSSHPNNQSLRDLGDEENDYDNVEIKFQLSFLLALAEGVVQETGDLYLGYTQVSFWNAYNSDLSAPFRDTNYEPELFMLFDTDFDVLGMQNRAISVGFVHESNGRGSDVLSRSWNRVYANFMLQKGDFTLTVKPWWRLPEDEEDDDNPNIERYMGYGEVQCFYKHRQQVFSAMLRNNLKSDGNKGAIELGWSFPIHGRFKGYVQYFNGYAETMLDYNDSNQRVGVGLMLSDWM
jgi:phospholipase A1